MATMLPDRIRRLDVSIGDMDHAGALLKTSTYEFRYLEPDPEQAAVALLMPPSERLTWQDGDLFPPMDQNLPEGDLFMKIRAMFPKQAMSPMHLLALVGRNGIGRLGYRLAEWPAAVLPRPLSKEELLKTRYTPEVFSELVVAYLSTGAGIAGMQPKIMVPDVQAFAFSPASRALPALSAARRAGRSFALSDMSMLILDRFL